jgi:class 3 adenylate cyclase
MTKTKEKVNYSDRSLVESPVVSDHDVMSPLASSNRINEPVIIKKTHARNVSEQKYNRTERQFHTQIPGRPRKLTWPYKKPEHKPIRPSHLILQREKSPCGRRLTFKESRMLTLQYTRRKMWDTSHKAFTLDGDEELYEKFKVTSFYNDESALTMAIPPNLQVTESKWTLRFQYDKIEDKVDGQPWQFEKTFIKERFRKSRRLVRMSIIALLLLAIGGALMQYQLIIIDFFIENESARRRRSQMFLGVLVPFALIWCLTTFTPFYEDNLTWLPALFVFIIGGCLLGITYIGKHPGKHPDNTIFMYYLCLVWLFIRVPFWNLLMVTSVMFVVYVVVVRWTQLYHDYLSELVELLYLLGTNVCLMYATYFWERTERVEFLDTQIKNYIQNNTKELLNQILPIDVQERVYIKDTGGFDMQPIAEEETHVSVLFSDIKGFTKFCSGVKAIDVVKALNDLYMTFDKSLQKLNVFKVETIGDAYFVSANCPIKVEDHARRLVLLGKEMIDACSKFPKDQKDKFQMRIGVHSGPVFAGVVGRKMPRYHLFGRTVTIAERLESSGEPGKVQISEVTKQYLEDWEKDSGSKLNFTWIPGSMEFFHEFKLKTFFVKFDTEIHFVL